MKLVFNIASLFLKQAKNHPERLALIAVNKQITYRELEKEVKQTVQYFHSKGIRSGDRVLVFIPMGFDLYRVVLALFSMGAVAVFLDEWVSFSRLAVCCKMARCKAFISLWYLHIPGWFSQEVREIPIHLFSGKPTVTPDTEFSLFEAHPDDPALITFTTGSTGIPKAANRTHGFLMAQFESLKPLIDNDSQIDMPMLPIVLLLNLAVGKTSVIAKFKSSKPKQFRSEFVLNQLGLNKVQSLTASPWFLVQMARETIRSGRKFPHLKQILSGGGPVFPHEATLVNEAFPQSEFTVVFGSTEAEPISHISGIDMRKAMSQMNDPMRGLLVGKPDSSIECLIIPIQEEAVTQINPLPPGESGELIVSGNHVLDSYIDNPEATRMNKIKAEGKVWHRTGDAAYFSDDGMLWLLGRCQGRIRFKERNFYPFQIEYSLMNLTPPVIGTLLDLESGPVLVVEKKSTQFQQEEMLVKLGLAEIPRIEVSQFPMDKRHHTKIDYSSLKELVSK